MQYYTPWVTDIVIFDGRSTDATIDIAKSIGGDKVIVKRFPGDSGDFVDDRLFRKIRNEAWKDGAQEYDWVIVCDADEFLFHKDLYNKLMEFRDSGITLPKVLGYEMISLEMPKPDIPIVNQITKGMYSEVYNKNIIFNPRYIQEINYKEGGHECFPVGVVNMSTDNLFLLHYRMLSYDYFVKKAQLTVSRLSRINLQNNWGYHNKRYATNYTIEDFHRAYDSTIELIN